MIIYIILFGYLALSLVLARTGLAQQIVNADQFYLNDRNLKSVKLFFTLIATNFSAFFFIGFAGEAYRVGYAYYAMMALGTSFAAVSFFLIGSPAWRKGKEMGFITPSETIGALLKSPVLSRIVAVLLIVFMIPFVGIQIIGAGLIISKLTAGGIPYIGGAALLMTFILIYVWSSGMYSVARLDVYNGLIMLTLIVTAFILISSSLGGISTINEKIANNLNALMSGSGKGQAYSPTVYLSFMLLWLTCLPMFPQIFFRFLMANKESDFKKISFLYTIVPPILFIFPVALGVMGHLSFPDLQGKEADQIIPMLMTMHIPKYLGALILTGALAAFVSTTDSTLLALSGVITRDLYRPLVKPDISEKEMVKIGRISILILCLISLVIAYFRPATIFQIATLTFSGLSVLFPVFLAALRFNYKNAPTAIAAIVFGELVLLYFAIIQPGLNKAFGILPVVPAVLISSLFVIIGIIWDRKK